jgi:eukaryotic-like serine/threonine-protein kinase
VKRQDAERRIGLREGDVLAGKYRVERVLGAGGMGVVVAAHHLGLDTKVAIKLLLPEMLDQEEVVARFAREARAAARITNEHVARVFDVGALEDGAPYMVMEFLDGSDLSEWLKRRGPLPVPEAVDFVLQACEAVAEAHAAGIVHRDLKPANLFCVRRSDGSLFIKVLDFGISKLTTTGAQSAAMTATAALMGTPFYMSPEQMDSARVVDGRTDIWALGIVLFELLTGDRPFGGQTMPEICLSIATHPAPRIRQQRPDVLPSVEAAILKCLEKQRSERFSTIGEMAAALAPFAGERSAWSSARAGRVLTVTSDFGQATASASDASELGLGSPQSLSALGHTKRVGSRRTPALLGFAGAAVALAAVAAAASLMGRSTPASPAPAVPATLAVPAAGAIDSGAPPAFAPPPDDLPRLSTATDATAAPALAREKEAPPQTSGGHRKTSAPAGVAPDSKRDSRSAVPRGNADPVNTASPFDERL